MTYVICQPCIGVKDASCVDVCPVDCIHAREEDEQYYIDPRRVHRLRRLRARLPGGRHLRRIRRSRAVDAVHRAERRLLRVVAPRLALAAPRTSPPARSQQKARPPRKSGPIARLGVFSLARRAAGDSLTAPTHARRPLLGGRGDRGGDEGERTKATTKKMVMRKRRRSMPRRVLKTVPVPPKTLPRPEPRACNSTATMSAMPRISWTI